MNTNTMQSGNGFNNTLVLSARSSYTRFALGKSSLKLARSVRTAAAATSEENRPESSSSTESEATNKNVVVPPPKKAAAGSGFGESSRKSSGPKKSSKGKSDAIPAKPSAVASTPGLKRRPAPAKPLITPQVDSNKQRNETIVEVFLLCFIAAIVIEGLGLATSGFLPEEWDEFLVNIIYPSFTPTVGVFLACASGYGLYKYLSGGQKN